MDNPLYTIPFLPDFAAIKPEHAEPALDARIAEAEHALATIEADATLSWDAVFGALHRATQPVSDTWGLVARLHSVVNNEAWREVHRALEPRVVAFSLRVAQSEKLYARYRALDNAAREKHLVLTEAQRRVLASALREARHAGVGLPDAQRGRVKDIHTELASLGAEFSNHVLDAIKNYSLWLRDPADAAGLPGSFLQTAAESARGKGEALATAKDGPWRVSLDAAVYVPFMRHAQSRGRREELYRAFVTKASTGALDNSPLIDRILTLRRELAVILGYETYAHLSCASKMSREPGRVGELLDRLAETAVPAARKEFAALQAFASKNLEGEQKNLEGERPREPETLQPWDIFFYEERQREALYNLTEEALRPYLPLENVLQGMFKLARLLFGIDVREVEPASVGASVWHPDTRLFQVLRADSGAVVAWFYLDPYMRPGEKSPGAWMDFIRLRYVLPNGAEQLPVALMVCNFPLPTDATARGDARPPSLLSFDDVVTLFHEFGHALQHMLTEELEPDASGIHNIEWDAVELASQFMENWCYDPPVLRGLARHHETGETLPDDLLHALLAAKNYRSGSALARQLCFGLTDLGLHLAAPPVASHALCHDVASKVLPLALLPEDRFLCSFSHIFAGGYAAGYYSYKWSELLSCDAFDAFLPALEPRDEKRIAETGGRFRATVLACGGGRDPLDVFRDFRGR
ncbi:MAG: M3 family metallopeptidase, partial [Kiritimatiellaeota bacterium]|nr:M3 family metallopeptidase [Kiritimatiellota bacterium]